MLTPPFAGESTTDWVRDRALTPSFAGESTSDWDGWPSTVKQLNEKNISLTVV